MISKKRVLKLIGLCLATALLGVGAEGIMRRLGDSAPELQRPDLLVAFGICVLVYLAGSESEAPRTLPEP
jgi:hypothetical protein